MKKLIKDILELHVELSADGSWPGEELVKGQQPEVLLITCSDSRVVPHIASRSGPGRIFVIRNAGNMLPHEGVGSSEEATIEFGVRALRIPDLIICGHTHCGAMAGLGQSLEHMPALRRWLRAGDEIDTKFEADADPAHLAATLTGRNVVAQLARATAYPAVAEAVAQGRLRLHGWVFDIEAGSFSEWDAHSGAFRPLQLPAD